MDHYKKSLLFIYQAKLDSPHPAAPFNTMVIIPDNQLQAGNDCQLNDPNMPPSYDQDITSRVRFIVKIAKKWLGLK